MTKCTKIKELDISKAKFTDMIGRLMLRQHELNVATLGETWIVEAFKNREIHYEMAAVEEIFEYLNYVGYKWWKKPIEVIDTNAVKMELIDILHFILSHCISRTNFSTEHTLGLEKDILQCAKQNTLLFESGILVRPENKTGIFAEAKRLVSILTSDALGDELQALFVWASLWVAHGFDAKDIEIVYVAKNLLNSFRQRYGYKQGTYKKIWATNREDNDFLLEWLYAQEKMPTDERVIEWLTSNYFHYLRIAA